MVGERGCSLPTKVGTLPATGGRFPTPLSHGEEATSPSLMEFFTSLLSALGALNVITHSRDIRAIRTGIHAEGLSTSIDRSLYPITLFFAGMWWNLLSVTYKNPTPKDAAI